MRTRSIFPASLRAIRNVDLLLISHCAGELDTPVADPGRPHRMK